ncbi:YigZ family protein [Alkalihalobacillus pseudalcaliphilus]|uniref:YigZ family protein n=1 Tax=Alkalihalobacillus pseudalcaliphilus TaxID=79884 RepID=UPI00064DC780|nr:YigZ family protein [Alkalihalobacillus pseudalcaliphilus]KMK77417.1 hypothetical protein AB990_02775 [Alkalihalobacillus pseudalcaliphilus]
MLEAYKTVKGYGEHELVIQKSRFISHFARINSEQEAQQFIDTIKKKHSNATHNCSAYILGEHDNIQKANDDGEPSGTAGVPMLEVLKKRQLKNTAVVVTRYFGGIKLGAGGLIRAYGSSVSEGLNHVGVVERTLMKVVHCSIDYHWLGKVENELRQSHYPLKEISYLEDVTVKVYVKEDEYHPFTEWMNELTNGQVTIQIHDEIYLEKII